MGDFHPVVVHFAIALSSIAIVADAIYQISGNERYGALVQPLLVGGVLFAFLAVATGLQAEKTIQIPTNLLDHVNTHRFSAILTTIGLMLTLLFRMLVGKATHPGGMLKWGYRFIAILTLALLFRTGLLGGELVYKYGIGTQQRAPANSSDKNLFENTK